MKKILIILLPLLLLPLLVGCTAQPDEPSTPSDETVIEGDGYTLTIKGTVLTKVKYTVPGAAVRVTVPEGVTETSFNASRMLFSAVSFTVPSTLENFKYAIPMDQFGIDIDFVQVVEIYDLSPHFDFDLENAEYSSIIKPTLKVIHKSENEKSCLTEKDGFIYYESDEETLLVGFTEFTDPMTVPAEYNGKPCEIGAYAFAKAKFGEVTISEGITTLGEGCFLYTHVSKFNLPSTLRHVGASAFNQCHKLESIDLPDGITEIGRSAFAYCSKLTSIRLPDALEILDNAVIQKTGITSLHIPANVSQIRMSLDNYGGFERLTEFTVHPDNPYFSAKDGVLFDKSGEKLIIYPASKEGTEYTVPDTVKEIASNAFYTSDNLTKITVSEGVEIIGSKAFCFSRIESITLPKSLTAMEDDAFRYCSLLTDISVHKDNPAYTVIDGVLFDKAVTRLIFYPKTKTDNTYTVPKTVTAICDYAAYDNDHLNRIILPDGLISIGKWAFYLHIEPLTVNLPNSLEYIGECAFSSHELIILKWNYTGDWIATNYKGETEILTQEHFNDLQSLKTKYLQDYSEKYTLEKVKPTE